MAGSSEAGKERRQTDAAVSGLVPDCRLMLSFARKNGFALSPALVHEIAWLDSVLRALEIEPVSKIEAKLVWPIDLSASAPSYVAHAAATDPNEPPPAGMSPEEVILDVHARLSALIAPTTALTLRTSEPPSGKHHLFGGMPPLVQMVILVAFISAVCFVVSASQIAGKHQRWKARREAAEAAASAASAAPAASAVPAASQGVAP